MPAPPFRFKLCIYQGSTLNDVVRWEVGTPPVPVDLTGCSARMQIRASVESPEVIAEFSTADGTLVLGGAAGTIAFNVSATETAAMSFDSGVHDLEITFANGDVRRLLAGPATLSREVTRG